MITDLKARKIAPDSKPIADGTVPGLRLEPGSLRGHGKWTLRFVSPETGKRRDMGLGAYPEVGLAAARARAAEARQDIAGGRDPISRREALRTAAAASTEALTFERAALQVHQDRRDGWKNAKHADQWVNTLRDYVFPTIGAQPVSTLSVANFADVLRPIWLKKPETASRVKQRCHAVMKWCMARGLVQGNPVDVVNHLLPQQPGKRERTKHQPSMPWRDIPAFVQHRLRGGATNVTRALLEFVILTAARSGEARAATWDEFDLETMVWIVPAARMKAKVTHRVPLSARAIEILQAQRERFPDAALAFPAPRGGVLSDMVLTKFLRDYHATSSDKGRVATAHGFRSSFRDWASENGYSRDLADRAIAHTINNQAEAAYHRTDLLDQRRDMMERWADHICSGAKPRAKPTQKSKTEDTSRTIRTNAKAIQQ